MRLCAQISSRKFKMAGSAVLCVFAFTSGALAQTPQTKAAPQPAPARSAPAAQPTWGVICPSGKGGLDCRALMVKQEGNVRFSISVRLPSDTKKPSMMLLLPLGLDLPAGVSVQFGKDAAKKIPFQSCDTSGCLAEYPVSETEIAAMLKGADVRISVQSQNNQPFTVQMPVAGFPEAYAKIQ